MRPILITSPEELSELEERWEALRLECGGTIYSSNFLTRTWYQAFSASSSSRAILIEEKGELLGVAPLSWYKYKAARLPIKVLTLAGDMRDRLRLSTNAIFYRPDRPDALEAIVREMKKLDWSILWTINMESSPMVGHYMDLVRSTWHGVECDVKKNLEIPLPAAGDLVDGYDKGAKRNYKKLMNRLEREGCSISLKKLGQEDTGRAVDVYVAQHIERWESKGGSYFRNPENVTFLKAAVNEAFARKKGFSYEMEINGEVAAQVFGFVEGKMAYAERIGMDDRFMRYSPGWLLCNGFLTDLRNKGVEVCAMGSGGERYKYEMGAKEKVLMGIGATRGMMSFMARLALSPRLRTIESKLGIMGGTAHTGMERPETPAANEGI